MSAQTETPDPGNSRDFSIDGPAGALEARMTMPKTFAQPQGAALVCHPHPSYGGTMDNKVVYMLARAGSACGLAALRFNFRGTGSSEGTFDQGHGEVDDCLAAAGWLRQALPEAKLVLAGFSFGAYVTIRAVHRLEPVQLISVAPPMFYFANDRPKVPGCPWLVVQGDADDVVATEGNLKALRALDPAPEIRVVEGAGHFFHGQLVNLRREVERALAARWAGLE
jgi:alpha/beta superfamily hydrolase